MKPIVQPRCTQTPQLRDIRCYALRKIGNNPQRSHLLKELNLERLCSGSLTPDRQIGPVEVQQLPGHGRGVVATENLQPGDLLFVSEPAGAVLLGEVGQPLLPAQLAQHWQTAAAKLSATDRYKLSVLATGSTPTAQLKPISFRDLSSSKATSKAKKATAKGFAAAANKQASSNRQPPAAAELSEEQLQQVVECNAYGDDHVDAALAACRGEQQHSVVGVWPEYSLLNHSCAPNTVPPVLMSDRLLLRTAVVVPAGQEVTTSYLRGAGGMPAQQRQELLQKGYGFACSCHRCKAESQAPAAVTSALQSMHEWSSQHDLESLLTLMEQGDITALTQIHQEATQLVQQLEQQLEQVQDALEVSWLRASAYGTYAVMLRVGEFLLVVRDIDAAQQLADLVRVFEPASESHLLLLSESAVRADEASRAGVTPSTREQTQELRVQQFVRALTLRYGEPRDLEVLTQLAGSLTTALGTHWLGVNDLCGSGRLDSILRSIAAVGSSRAGGDGGRAAATAAGGKQKAEIGLQQLSKLQ